MLTLRPIPKDSPRQSLQWAGFETLDPDRPLDAAVHSLEILK